MIRFSRFALTILSADLMLGLIAALGQAPWGMWPLTLLALAFATARIAAAATPRQAGWHGFALGLGYFGLAMSWIVEPFFVQPEIYGWMAPFALFLMAAGGAVFWTIAAWVSARVVARGPQGHAARICGFALGLAAVEWLRGWVFTGLPWAQTGHIWIGTPVSQLAAFVGALGLTLFTSALVALACALPANRRIAGLGLGGAALAAGLVLGAWVMGQQRLSAPLPADQGVRLRLVQPNAIQALKWDRYWSSVFYDRLLTLSAATPQPGQPRPDLVIWPETAVSFLLNDATPVLEQFTQAASAPVLTGIQRRDGMAYFNSLAMVEPGGRVSAVYDKAHLVPFGEYIPWGDALARLGIGAFAAQQGNGYSAGPGPALMSPPGLPAFQPLICYEAIFPQVLRQVPRAKWLLLITNDSWFGHQSGPWQHLAQARLRAIESGLPVIRAANTGISAVIGPRGQIRAELPLDRQGFIDATLPAHLDQTPWMRFGDGPILALMALASILIGAFCRRR